MLKQYFLHGLGLLSRRSKILILMGNDAVLLVASVWIAIYLRTGGWNWPIRELLMTMATAVALGLPLLNLGGVYRSIARYAGLADGVAITQIIGIYGVFFALIFTAYGIAGVPRTVGLIQPILVLLLVGASRGLVRILLGDPHSLRRGAESDHRVLIYGAGAAGRQLAGAIRTSRTMQLAGFVDDDPALHSSRLNGVRIFDPAGLAVRVARDGITDILLAIPSASRARKTEIIKQLQHLNLHVRTLPGLVDIARGEVRVQDLREVEIVDLLARQAVEPDLDLLRQRIAGNVVLITGAGGSIGSELCRQIHAAGPRLMLLAEMSEFNLYAIHRELQSRRAAGASAPEIVPLMASVCDERRVREIMATWPIDLVVHAAAYKHVPLVEHNLLEGVRNNVFGTYTLARLARQYGIPHFLFISTDKAVRPTNVMGATKRMGEMILQGLQTVTSSTCFSMVRFGNVLDSSGSVVPLFREQIARGGPVTITHPEVTRYFMTIPEASQLVLQASAMGTGGDVFVLDMGDPVRIMDLARGMIELSGLTVRDEGNPDGDIAIHFVGLRPGEKLYEELLIGNEPIVTAHPRIMRAREGFMPWQKLEHLLAALADAVSTGDADQAWQLLREAVPDFAPGGGHKDWIKGARIRANPLPAVSGGDAGSSGLSAEGAVALAPAPALPVEGR